MRVHCQVTCPAGPAAMATASVTGISTRSVDELVKASGMGGISENRDGRLCEEFDERVAAFRAADQRRQPPTCGSTQFM